MLDKAAVEPVSVELVIQFLLDRRVVRVLTGEDVLFSHELHVEAALGLGAKDLDRAGEHDDEAVAGIDGLGGDAGEVRGLPALYVTDDQPLGLLDLGPGGFRQSADHVRGRLVQSCDRLLWPILDGAQVVLVVLPVHVGSLAAGLFVPGFELL